MNEPRVIISYHLSTAIVRSFLFYFGQFIFAFFSICSGRSFSVVHIVSINDANCTFSDFYRINNSQQRTRKFSIDHSCTNVHIREFKHHSREFRVETHSFQRQATATAAATPFRRRETNANKIYGNTTRPRYCFTSCYIIERNLPDII